LPYKDKDKRKEHNREYRIRLGEKLRDKKISYWVRQRLEVLSHYSNGDVKCSCCGEREYKFLCLDHINGGGTQHRKSLGTKYIFSFLKQAGFPEGYQVLCYNCNMAKGFYGKCPHKEMREDKNELLKKSL
jgi:hypothetical protein